MYYAWGWWIFWVFFICVIVFGLFAWRPSRNSRYPSDYRYPYQGPSWPYGYAPPGTSGNYRGRGPRDYRRSDARIAEDINDQLLINDDVDATDVAVQVREGLVTLSGSVSTRPEKRIAEFVAESVPGVLDVKNELAIRRDLRKDQERTERPPTRAA